MGSLVQMVAALKGPRSIVVADVRSDALARAAGLGATRVVDATSESLVDAVREVTDDRGADVVYEVTGVYPLARLADAFEVATARPAGFVKAVLEPGA